LFPDIKGEIEQWVLRIKYSRNRSKIYELTGESVKLYNVILQYCYSPPNDTRVIDQAK